MLRQASIEVEEDKFEEGLGEREEKIEKLEDFGKNENPDNFDNFDNFEGNFDNLGIPESQKKKGKDLSIIEEQPSAFYHYSSKSNNKIDEKPENSNSNNNENDNERVSILEQDMDFLDETQDSKS